MNFISVTLTGATRVRMRECAPRRDLAGAPALVALAVVYVAISAEPENHRFSTSNTRVAKPWTAKCSRVLISSFTRDRTTGAIVVSKR